MFKFAIMGAGRIAQKFCNAVELVPDCKIVAVSSKNLARAHSFAQEHQISKFYDDYETMLQENQIDCVYISVTTNDHYRLSKLCMKYFVPVLCEKAMFCSASEAADLWKISQDNHVFAMEAMWSRFLPAILKAKDWVTQGRIGRETTAHFSIGFQAPRDPQGRYFSKELGGGAAYDLGVYGYELLTWLIPGSVVDIQTQALFLPNGVDTTDEITLRFPHALASITSTLECPMEEALVIYGTEGKIYIPQAHMAKEAILCSSDGCEIEHFTDTITQNGFQYQIQEVMKCIKKEQLESPTVPHSLTLDCAKMFDLLFTVQND